MKNESKKGHRGCDVIIITSQSLLDCPAFRLSCMTISLPFFFFFFFYHLFDLIPSAAISRELPGSLAHESEFSSAMVR